MDRPRRAEPGPTIPPNEDESPEAALAELRVINEQLLLASLREQALATEARRLAERLTHRALHDEMTGLPNRALFIDRARLALLAAKRDNTTLAILFLDLDGFKAVNDAHGHHTGDLVLQQVAERLRTTLRESDTAARLGSDEFAVLLNRSAPEEAFHVARRMSDALASPCVIAGVAHQIGASIGLACYPQHGAEIDTLLRHADAAMYSAKEARTAGTMAGPDSALPAHAPAGARAPARAGRVAAAALAEIRTVNERLVLAGLHEQELADQLRHQLAFTEAITGTLGDGIIALDPQCLITFANPAAGQLLGRAVDDLSGRDIHTLLPGPAANSPSHGVFRSRSTHREDDGTFIRDDGTIIPVAFSVAPILAAARVIGAVVAFRDITAQKEGEARQRRINEELEARVRERTATLHAATEALQRELAARHRSEAALRERETRLRLILEQTPAVIWTTDNALRFTFAAGANLTAIGLGPRSVVGRPLPEITGALAGDETGQPDEHGHATLAAHRRALAGEAAAYTTVRSGRTFQVYVEPLRDTAGAITGTIAIAQDITELSLRRLHDEFIATVSHHLLTPLAAARAGLGLLTVGVAGHLPDADERLLANIGRNIGRLEIHLNDLITLNQLKSGTALFVPGDLDLRTVIASALSVVQPLLREKGQELVVVLPEALPLTGDPDGLEQALINLLANAHRHTPPGTRVTIAGRQVGDEIHVTVADTGPGIPAEALSTIFQRFQRLAVPGATATTGSGLGLAIVAGIATLHGGRAWGESAPERGATFHLALPSRQPHGEREIQR